MVPALSARVTISEGDQRMLRGTRWRKRCLETGSRFSVLFRAGPSLCSPLATRARTQQPIRAT
jgi:hypothetical protein